MPLIGIVRGFGEGYIATEYIVKLIKALNRRFRSSIRYELLECGDYITHGAELSDKAINQMKECDCIFISDFESKHNRVEYTSSDIAYALCANVEYTHISGFDKYAELDLCIASYFDGGFKMRDGSNTIQGCTETRVCSTFAISNVVKEVSRKCEARRRRLAFVKDFDNEYCADFFRQFFKQFVLPLSNFQFIEFSPRELCNNILVAPLDFDTVFASRTFSDTIQGIAEYLTKDKFTCYKCYNSEKTVYALHSVQSNSACGEYVPSIYSYISALCDLLKKEFNMQKEAAHLRRAVDAALAKGADCNTAESFVEEVINSLSLPVTTKYSKRPPAVRYIK